ncbi:MAG: hypothetical protein M1132_03250 [Chloroflexi bacterium]|nr:hypothetical protein [Chloroflexota bacterium]
MAGQFSALSSSALLCALVLLAAMGYGCAPASAAITPAVPTPDAPYLFNDTDQKPGANVTADKTVLRTRYATVNLSLFQATGGPQSVKQLKLNLFPDVIVTASLDRIDRPSPDGFVWVGHVQGAANSQVALSVQDNVMAGSISIPNDLYLVRYVGSGLHAINQIDQAAFPPD